MLPLRTIAFLMSFVGLSAGSLIVPALGVFNYLMIYQVYPEHAWWHLPIEALGLRYSMTAAVCLMLGILINLPRMPSVRPRLSVWDLAALGMVFVVVLGEFTGLGPSRESVTLTDKFVKMMIFVFCMTRVTTTRRSFTIVMWALVLGSLYIGYDAWTAPRGAFARGRLEVVGGPDFRHSSGLAAHMAAMLPVIGATFLTTHPKVLRLIPLVSGALTVNTVVLCRTRSAFVGLVCGTMTAVLFAPRRRRFRTYVALIFATGCAFALTDDLFWERMATLRDRQALREDAAAMGRVTIWVTARQVVAEHPLGVGIGNFPGVLMKVNPEVGKRAAHNTFLLCITELGIQGFALFAVILFSSVYGALYCYRRAEQTSDPPWTRYMAYALLLSIVISCGTQLFTERLYTESFWWVLALPGCLCRVVRRELAAARDACCTPQEQGSWHATSILAEGWSAGNPLVSGGLAPGPLA